MGMREEIRYHATADDFKRFDIRIESESPRWERIDTVDGEGRFLETSVFYPAKFVFTPKLNACNSVHPLMMT